MLAECLGPLVVVIDQGLQGIKLLFQRVTSFRGPTPLALEVQHIVH